jgi:hypothetical protein
METHLRSRWVKKLLWGVITEPYTQFAISMPWSKNKSHIRIYKNLGGIAGEVAVVVSITTGTFYSQKKCICAFHAFGIPGH